MGLFNKSGKSAAELAIGSNPELLAVGPPVFHCNVEQLLTPQKVLPANPKSWYRTRHFILLYLTLLVPLFSSASVGFDGMLRFD